MKKQFTILLLVVLYVQATAVCQQQYAGCLNNLVMSTAAIHQKNPCMGGDKLVRIDAFSYRDTILYQLVFQQANPCPDYTHSIIFYDNNCQVKIEVRDGGIKYRHQVIPSYIDTKQLVFKKSLEWQSYAGSQASLKNAEILTVTDKGKQLQQFYFSLNVEALWLSGSHINWETGEADKPEATTSNHTHCSAFVAAACKKLNIYILRPPEHKQELLSNAQFDWLLSPAASNNGWRSVQGNNVYEEAQNLANKGMVVIAICKNPDNTKPGHVALVMPEESASEKLKKDGPEVIMAGTHNHNRISLKAGFKSHLTEWPENAVQFYYNITAPQFPVKVQ